MTQLRVLHLDKAKRLRDDGLQLLSRVLNCDITDYNTKLKLFLGLTNLTTLGLAATSTTSASIPSILPLQALTDLNLASVMIIDDSLINITRSLTNLRNLVIKACTFVTNESFTSLASSYRAAPDSAQLSPPPPFHRSYTIANSRYSVYGYYLRRTCWHCQPASD